MYLSTPSVSLNNHLGIQLVLLSFFPVGRGSNSTGGFSSVSLLISLGFSSSNQDFTQSEAVFSILDIVLRVLSLYPSSACSGVVGHHFQSLYTLKYKKPIEAVVARLRPYTTLRTNNQTWYTKIGMVKAFTIKLNTFLKAVIFSTVQTIFPNTSLYIARSDDTIRPAPQQDSGGVPHSDSPESNISDRMRNAQGKGREVPKNLKSDSNLNQSNVLDVMDQSKIASSSSAGSASSPYDCGTHEGRSARTSALNLNKYRPLASMPDTSFVDSDDDETIGSVTPRQSRTYAQAVANSAEPEKEEQSIVITENFRNRLDTVTLNRASIETIDTDQFKDLLVESHISIDEILNKYDNAGQMSQVDRVRYSILQENKKVICQ